LIKKQELWHLIDIIRKDIGDDMTKIGKKKLRMSDGTIRTFGSEEKRDNYERVAQAIKHGWKPTKKKR